MTPEEQRIAIAEACGWKRIAPFKVGREKCDWPVWEKDGKRASILTSTLPDYLNDLNAMHEVEKILNEKEQVWYLQKLTQVRFREGIGGMIGCMIDKIAFATAAQRSEAFLRTIKKWKEI